MERLRTAFGAEAQALAEVMLNLAGEEFDRPTPCPPWTVSELLAHVRTATGRLVTMPYVDGPPEINAISYYRPEIFAPDADGSRVAAARQEAGDAADGHALAEDFDRTWRAALDRIEGEPAGRVVRTRHGDAIRLDDFTLTRVVELGVHGLDLAIALNREPWFTAPAAEAVARLLIDEAGEAALGWGRVGFIARATGRIPLTEADQAKVAGLGIRWLTLSTPAAGQQV